MGPQEVAPDIGLPPGTRIRTAPEGRRRYLELLVLVLVLVQAWPLYEHFTFWPGDYIPRCRRPSCSEKT